MLDGFARNIIILWYYFTPFRSHPSLRLLPFLFVSFFTLCSRLFSNPSSSLILNSHLHHPLQRFNPRATIKPASRHRVLKKPGYCKYLFHHLPSFSHKDELLAVIEYAMGTNDGVFILFTRLANAIYLKRTASKLFKINRAKLLILVLSTR